MAEKKEYTAYEVVRELLKAECNKSKVAGIVSMYPLFSKEVLTAGTVALENIFSTIPTVTAEVIEKGLRMAGKSDGEEEKPEKKKPGRPASKPKSAKEEPEEAENPYAGKSAKDLYMMCKERGISVKPKQSASDYAKLLIKYDQDTSEPDDDDWGEDESQEEEKPVKKKPGRPAKKKDPEPEEEADDDDWEI